MEEFVMVNVKKLKKFAADILVKYEVSPEDAEIAADVLVTADQRGVHSHGIQRLLLYYVDRIIDGNIRPKNDIHIIKETPCSLHVSGEDGLGQAIGYKTMKRVIEKAKKNHLCIASVCNSNHYGIAAYYSMMALEHDLIGISLTNSVALVVPTFGKDGTLGTNPISVAVPARTHWPFVLDMATATVPRGKLELYDRENKPIPLCWATDTEGIPTSNARIVLENTLARKGGGLLPLGGAEEETGGHKGYGLCVVVDILSGILSGSAYATKVWEDRTKPAKVGHFFGAINVDAFIGLEVFKDRMDEYIELLKNAPKAKGKDRIWIHGEKEYELFEKQEHEVKILRQVVEELRDAGKDLSLDTFF